MSTNSSSLDQRLYSSYERALLNYQRRYIRPGSSAPLFHVMVGVLTFGILVEAKAHRIRVKEGGHH